MAIRDETTVYGSLFVHRWDCYAVQQRDGSYWRETEPLTDVKLNAHLRGWWTLGTYLLDAQSCCSFAVFDADQDDGLMWLAVLAWELARQGIPSLLEASRRGGHLWVHFTKPTPARLVRAWLLPYAQGFRLELYPKQDALAVDGAGSLIRLPLGIHRKSRGWYPFVQVTPDWELVAVGTTVEACCLWATQHLQRVTLPEIEPVASPGPEAAVPTPGVVEGGSIRQWCQAQDIAAVIGRSVALDARGVGSCPFKEHHHRGDVRPSFQVFAGDNPHWYCYTWGRAGDVFDFLCLYHHLTPQEGWQWLQEGRFA